MSKWELTSKERIKLVSRWVRASLETEPPRDKDAIDLVDMVQKASQKKLVEWMQAHSMAELVEPFGESIVIKFKDWQALCRGVK